MTGEDVRRADYCVVACAEAWRGDGEILASAFGTIPTIGARLARATFSPDLLISDGDGAFVAGDWAVDARPPAMVEGWAPFSTVFDVAWAGRRHAMMGPSQLDRAGNANISCIGPFEKPTRQLLGLRGAPGNTVNHPNSYWVPRHSPQSFVEAVDVVSGVGYRRAAEGGFGASRFHDLHVVVTNLCVLDFNGPDHVMQVISIHPGVTADEVTAATGFDLVIADDVISTRRPTAAESDLVARVLDPNGLRYREVRD